MLRRTIASPCSVWLVFDAISSKCLLGEAEGGCDQGGAVWGDVGPQEEGPLFQLPSAPCRRKRSRHTTCTHIHVNLRCTSEQ